RSEEPDLHPGRALRTGGAADLPLRPVPAGRPGGAGVSGHSRLLFRQQSLSSRMAGKRGRRSACAGSVYPHQGRGHRPYLADGWTGTARPGSMQAAAQHKRHDNAVTIRTTTRYAAALLVAASMLFCGLLQAAQINNVRLWRAPDNTRLVFDLSGPADHT